MILHFKRRRTAIAFFLFLIAIACVRLSAQEATLDGQVTDSTGAVLTGAQITVKNVDTSITTVSVSGNDGYYHVGSLTAGNYSVAAEKDGFERSVRQGVRLEVAQHATVDITLAPGSVSQTVTVSGEPPQLQVESADQGEAVDEERMLTLPTQGHNPIAGVFSVPGVSVTSADQRLRAFDLSGSSGFSINGAPGGTSEVLVDGVSSMIPVNGGISAAYIPTVESTSQLKVQTTNFDSEYGWTLGGVVNMVTQGGINQFHGAAWEYLQNTVLDANNFSGNYNHTPRTSSHINTFGAHFSGPIIKNKLFFDYTYENLRQVIPDPFVVSVPTALQKTGDFSQTYSAPGQQQTIYDPFSTTTDATGQLVRTPFPNNVIPANRLDPVALKILSYIPNGNVPGNSVTGLNNLVNSGTSHKFTDFFPENTIRVDYSIDEKTRMFARYSRNALQEERNFHYSTVSSLNPADTGANTPFTRENHNSTVQLTRILNPTTVLDTRVGFERFKTENGSQQGANHGPGTLGFSPTFASQAANWFPTLSWANYGGAGAWPTWSTTSYNYALESVLSKMIGRYSIKFGTDLRLLRSNIPNAGYDAGNFSFDQGFTGANPLQIQPSSGNAIASFLLGVPTSGYIQVNSEPARQQKMISLFEQNDIRISEKLKLNLGVRWDYLGPLTDRFNGLAWFNPEAPSPFQVPGKQLFGGLVFAGVNGDRRGIYDQSWGNFAPRAGVSYKLNDKTVLHGGYALMYGHNWNDPGEAAGFSQTTNMVTSIQPGVPFNTLDNPFPSGILKPQGASQGLATALGQTINFGDPHGKMPYSHQYTVEIQRQLPGDLLLSAAFVGTHAVRLPVTQQLNAVPLSAMGLGSSGLKQLVSNPFAGLLPGTALNGATIAQQQLLVPYPQFLINGVTEQFRPIGSNAYYAGQFLVSKRLSHGLDFTAEYTASKQLDQNLFANPQDTTLQKVIDGNDIARNMQINLLWQLPFGSGRAYGGSLYRPVRWFISGWDASSLTRLQSGMPLDLSGSPNSVPIANPKLAHPGLSQWFNSCTVLANGSTQHCVGNEQPAWTVRSFLTPQVPTLQTWPMRLSSVRKPGVHNSDISLEKNSHVSERVNVIFRTDFINAFNSAQFFSGPVSDVNNGNFGKIAGAMDQSNLPRFVQFSLKTEF